MNRRSLSLGAIVIVMLLCAFPAAAAAELGNKAPDAAVQAGSERSLGSLEQGILDKLHKGKMTKEEFEAYRFDKLKEMAVYFGIKTDGKTAEQLKAELEAAKLADKDKWEAYKAEQRAKRLEHLRKHAAEHGIDTKDKTSGQLHDELKKFHGNDEHHSKEYNQMKRVEEKR